MIPLRLIATQDDELTAAIIKATNSQTRVRAEQLLALSDFQKSLELYFKSFDASKRLYYERRSRQYDADPQVEGTRIVTMNNLVQSFAAMFLEEPHRVTKSFSAFLRLVGDKVFGASHVPDIYYLAAVAHCRLEFLFRRGAIDSKFKVARHHILLATRLLSETVPLPAFSSNKCKKYAADLVIRFWESERIFLRAVKCIDDVANGDFDRENIRTQGFTQAVVARCRELNEQ